MADVTCDVYVYYDGAYSGITERRTLHAGGTYTPSAHLPSYDSSSYELSSIGAYIDGQYITIPIGGSITAPSSYFTLDYFFTSITPPPPTSITATIYNIYGQGTPQQVTTRTLSVGAQYTPSSNVPAHTAGYDLTQIYTTAGGWTDVTTGSFTVPAYDISIYYYFETTPTSCNVVIYYDGASQGVAETRQYTKGATIHPRSNQPSYDSANYELESIWCYKSEDGSYTDVTTGYVTVPYSGYMTLDYMYVSKSNAFVFDGVQWRRATPYIFDGVQWVQAKGYIYTGSGWEP